MDDPNAIWGEEIHRFSCPCDNAEGIHYFSHGRSECLTVLFLIEIMYLDYYVIYHINVGNKSINTAVSV